MAVVTENANRVWMKAKAALANASPAAQLQFKELKHWLATQKNIQELQYVPIGDLGVDAVVIAGALKVYGIYLKKSSTATGSFFKASDHATVVSDTAAEILVELNAANAEAVLMWPAGYAQTLGLTIGADTTADGGTASTAGDGPNGFVILGAA
jgi:hypothetical protein